MHDSALLLIMRLGLADTEHDENIIGLFLFVQRIICYSHSPRRLLVYAVVPTKRCIHFALTNIFYLSSIVALVLPILEY